MGFLAFFTAATVLVAFALAIVGPELGAGRWAALAYLGLFLTRLALLLSGVRFIVPAIFITAMIIPTIPREAEVEAEGAEAGRGVGGAVLARARAFRGLLLEEPMGLSVGGLFHIDGGVVLGLLGGALAALVVLLQLHEAVCPLPTNPTNANGTLV